MRIVVAALTLLVALWTSPGLATIVNVATSLDGNKLNLTSIEVSQPNLGLDRTMALQQLRMPRLTNYQSIAENNTANTITIFGTPDSPPPESDDRLALISDGALNTGIFNPSTAAPGLNLAFDPPLINGPGTDVIVFDLTIGTETPDPFTLSLADGAGTPKSVSSGSYGIHGVIPAVAAPATWLATVANGASAELTELLGPTTTAGITSNPQWWAVGVDLTSLGVADWAQVSSLVLTSKDATHAIDALMIAGLPPATSLGDYDANGVIDVADYAFWRGEFGASATFAGGGADGDGNGFIDAADYVVWRGEAARAATAMVRTVPETPSRTLVAIAVFSVLGARSSSARQYFKRSRSVIS